MVHMCRNLQNVKFAEGRPLKAWAVCSLMEREEAEGENPLTVRAFVYVCTSVVGVGVGGSMCLFKDEVHDCVCMCACFVPLASIELCLPQ